MPAGVGEGVQHPRLIAAEQHAAQTDRHSSLITWAGQLGGEADTRPAAVKKVSLLPREDRGINVGRPRQHAAVPERAERVRYAGLVERSERKP